MAISLRQLWDRLANAQKRNNEAVMAEVNRLEAYYGADAYIQAWFALEEAPPFSRHARIMECVTAELAKKRGAQIDKDTEVIDFHRECRPTF